jgi:hypothetical protein
MIPSSYMSDLMLMVMLFAMYMCRLDPNGRMMWNEYDAVCGSNIVVFT